MSEPEEFCEWCDCPGVDCEGFASAILPVKCCPDCTHIWTRWAECLLTGQEG